MTFTLNRMPISFRSKRMASCWNNFNKLIALVKLVRVNCIHLPRIHHLSQSSRFKQAYVPMAQTQRELYPEIEPFSSGFLRVTDIHEVYYEESGKRDGKPVIHLHGGPGGGTSPLDRRRFDPDVYRIVIMDQRGAGKSRPPAELRENNTWALVSDIERLREHLNIDKWMAFGGSWGATLSLTYAIKHPDRVTALVVRGIFTHRRKELSWFYQGGCSDVFADYYDSYIKPIPAEERHDIIAAYYKRLTGPDKEVQLECARCWSSWEMATARLHVDRSLIQRTEDDQFALQFSRIESHYFVNKGFFETDDWLLDNVKQIEHIPMTIIQGRYDMVCPMTTAWELHKRLPKAEFHLVADAGHSAKEPGIQSLLLAATDKYRDL